jgi:hypothetical protein
LFGLHLLQYLQKFFYLKLLDVGSWYRLKCLYVCSSIDEGEVFVIGEKGSKCGCPA